MYFKQRIFKGLTTEFKVTTGQNIPFKDKTYQALNVIVYIKVTVQRA